MFTRLISFDTYFFRKINQEWSNSFFDSVLPALREAKFWIPLYVFLLFYSIYKFRKMAIFWIIAAAVLAGVSDQTGMILKNIFKRLRPCQIHDGIVNARLLLADCPSSYSFVSNHAINHFSFALFIILTLQFKKQYINAVFIFWAFIIGYSQIYVGVHFPLDVLGGAVAGIILGYFFAFLYRKLITFANSKRVKNM